MERLKNKLDSITVPPENPFAYDALNRKPLVDLLADRIAKSETPYVLAVNGPWGSGKTVLIQMLVAHLRQQNFISIHFNAWEHDHGENALAAMVCSLDKQLEKKSGAAKSVKKAAKPLVHGCVKLAASYAGVALLVEALEALLSQKASDEWSPLKSHEDYLVALKKFKDELAKIGTAGTPLVFFVDELDRCRPDFAVEVLEKIKHVFDVANVYFVVSLNRDILAMTIRKVYGFSEIEESDKYLRRFFDDEVVISQGDMTESLVARIRISGYFQTCEEQVEDLPSAKKEEKNITPRILSMLFRAWSAFISLRDQEQIVARIGMAMRCVRFDRCVSVRLMVYFAALKFRDKNLYNETRKALGKINEHGGKSNADFPWEKHFDLLDSVMSSGTITTLGYDGYDGGNFAMLRMLCQHMAVLAYQNWPKEKQALINEWWQKPEASGLRTPLSDVVRDYEFRGIDLNWDPLFYFNKLDGVDPDIYDDELKKIRRSG